MENNFNESMNLGNFATSGFANGNVGSEPLVAPVFQTTTTGNAENITINIPSEPVGVVQNMHSQVIEHVESAPVTASAPAEVQAEAKPEVKVNDPIVYNDTIVPVAILKSLVSEARKIGTYNPIRVVTQVIEVELGSFGIKVNASNGNIDYERIDNNVTYTTSFKVCVDIAKLGDLVNNLDCEQVRLEVENGILKVTMPDGSEFLLPERVDNQTQQPIELSLTFPFAQEDMTTISYEDFTGVINSAKPVRAIPKVDEEFAGILFSNLVLASDQTIIYVQDNQQILKTQKFFVGSELCDVITSLNFNKNNFRIGFTNDSSNDIRAITLSDGKLTICGNVDPDCPINEDACTSFWNAKFENSVTIQTKKLSSALKRLKIFNANDKQDYVYFSVANNSIKMTLENQTAKENLLVTENPTNYSGDFQLPLTLLDTIITSIKSNTLTICCDDKFANCVGLLAAEYKWIVAEVAENY